VSAKKGDKIIKRHDFNMGILNDAVWARGGDIYVHISTMDTTGRKYRIVLCWSSQPSSNPYTNDPLGWDVDLTLYVNGLAVASSSSYDNAFEIIEYTPTSIPVTEAYVRIHLYSGGGTSYYGLTWGKYDN
jgi:hypothetical protein